MAKQTGTVLLHGTINNITFYEMDGTPYARGKSSLTRHRVLTDPAFENSRKCSARFGAASVIASAVYRTHKAQIQGRGFIGKLTGLAQRLLRKGINENLIKEELVAFIQQQRDKL
ncbi:MAG: hypothetical protein JST86_11600 [Bacteroidetes bacterium]|nr:hypothetical protein [Bacteroidota bacterium]